MPLWVYTIFIYLYNLVIQGASFCIPKAKKWSQGRKNWHANLVENIHPGKWIWFHCASLGEFEQGRPVMEALLEAYPDHKLLLTFFSPSGFEIRQNYNRATYVSYLPLDSPSNAQKFVETVKPQLAVFVKYDFWIHHLQAALTHKIPILVISARMLPNSSFITGPLHKEYRKLFAQFEAIFTQDESTASLLTDFSPDACIMRSSDTRFDRVLKTRSTFQDLPEVAKFVAGKFCLVGGSTWPKGEQVLHEVFDQLHEAIPFCMILAPHEIHPYRIQQWIQQYPDLALPFSQIEKRKPTHRILWIDNIGMLSRLYAYAQISYIGGAWDKGLHNTLEAVVFGSPVFFGPKYEKYPEAYELQDAGIGFSISQTQQAIELIQELWQSAQLQAEIRRKCSTYIELHAGATQQIVEWVHAKQLLA